MTEHHYGPDMMPPDMMPPDADDAPNHPAFSDGSLPGCLSALAVVALVVAGCGASALRGHVTAADALYVSVDSAGPTIVQACALDLDRCAPGDTVCVDGVEHRCVTAAAARDALITPASIYRDQALAACGVDPHARPVVVPEQCPDAPPGIVESLARAAATVWRDLPTLTAALAALGGGT